MGGYPVFSAPGPTVDVRLFGEAAQQGAQLGQEIPNPVTSAITGAEAGIKYGQDFTREQAQISDTQAVAQIHQLEAEKQAATQSADIQATQAVLQDTTIKANNDAQQITAQNKFYDDYQAADAATQKKLVTSGQAFNVLGRSPGLYKNFLEQASLNPSWSPDERQQLNTLIGHAKIDDYYQKLALKQAPVFEKAKAAWLEGPGQDTASRISNMLNVPVENASDVVRWVKASDVQVDPETNHVKIDRATGRDVLTSSLERDALYPKGTKSPYLAVSKLPGSEGLIVADNVDPSVQGLAESYRTQRGVQNGMQAQYAKQFGDRLKPAQDAPPLKAEIPTFNTRGGAQAPEAQKGDPFKVKLQAQLGWNDEQAKAADASLTTLKTQIRSYADKPLDRIDPATVKGINHTVNTAARSITDHQFDTDPAVQALNTPSHVVKYNESIDAITDSSYFSLLPASVRDSYKAVLQAYKVDSPKDLYYQAQRAVIVPKLASEVIKIMTDIQGAKVKDATKSQALNSRNSYLSKWASGPGGQ